MAEINVRIIEINNSISKLESLRSNFESNKKTPPVSVGGGKTVNELENIVNMYKTIDDSFINLISNTISFLKNVRDSYASSDAKAAKGMTGR